MGLDKIKNIDREFFKIFLKTLIYWIFIPSILIIAIVNFNYKKVELHIENYESIFYSDRKYHSNNIINKFSGYKVILIPRHMQYDIIIDSLKGATSIYRLLSDKNDNSIFKSWSNVRIPIFVKGQTCNLNYVVKKRFNSKIIKLKPGGPIASSPIIISNEENKKIKAYYKPNLLKNQFPNGFFNFIYHNASIDRLFKLKLISSIILSLFLLVFLSYKRRFFCESK